MIDARSADRIFAAGVVIGLVVGALNLLWWSDFSGSTAAAWTVLVVVSDCLVASAVVLGLSRGRTREGHKR